MAHLATVTPINRGKHQMPSKNGYIHLWRDVKKQPFYKDLIARGMFFDMLLDAQHSSKKIEVDGVTVFLNTGQLFTKRSHFVEQGIDDSKVKRTLEKFEQLGIITRETLKKGKRSIGQRITFLNWKKWQKIDQSTDQCSDQPDTAEIKGLTGGIDQCSDQSTDQENNNDSNKLVPKGTCQKSIDFSRKHITEIVKLYSEILPSLPQPRKITSARAKSLKARHLNDLKGEIDNWRKYFEYIEQNCSWMLTGEYNIDFDYVIKQSNMLKIMEGAKNDRG